MKSTVMKNSKQTPQCTTKIKKKFFTKNKINI